MYPLGEFSSPKASSVLVFVGLLAGCSEESQPVEEQSVEQLGTWRNPKDDSLLREVPSGMYWIGSNTGDEDERPKFQTLVEGFFISETEVTNEQYALFLTYLYERDKPTDGLVATRGDFPRPTEIVKTNRGYRPSYGFESHPVMAVSFEGAQRYCGWARLRLPTEVEWEAAARGGQTDSKYPWGDESPQDRANYGKKWSFGMQPAPTMPVASFAPNGYGLYDMSGNVYEWTASRYQQYGSKNPIVLSSSPDERIVVRGGSWGSKDYELRVSFRRNYVAKTISNFVGGLGFRCAKDASTVKK